jgi:putative addiction module killer protein
MREIRETEEYAHWFSAISDEVTRARILARIRRLSLGNPGDVRAVGGGVSEMRLSWGPGYRVYFVERGRTVVVLLGGGTKKTQSWDIRRAIELAARV